MIDAAFEVLGEYFFRYCIFLVGYTTCNKYLFMISELTQKNIVMEILDQQPLPM